MRAAQRSEGTENLSRRTSLNLFTTSAPKSSAYLRPLPHSHPLAHQVRTTMRSTLPAQLPPGRPHPTPPLLSWAPKPDTSCEELSCRGSSVSAARFSFPGTHGGVDAAGSRLVLRSARRGRTSSPLICGYLSTREPSSCSRL